MNTRIIRINEDKCNGCGLCVSACHEGAIAMVNGKAKLLYENHCDGLGDCLPVCPVNAISFEDRQTTYAQNSTTTNEDHRRNSPNFPVQLRLMASKGDYLQGADLLIAADCCAYCHRNFHNEFMDGKVTFIACPKLDGQDYSIKLAQILMENEIRSLTVARMTVPCCGGLTFAAEKAVDLRKKQLPIQIVLIHPDGTVKE